MSSASNWYTRPNGNLRSSRRLNLLPANKIAGIRIGNYLGQRAFDLSDEVRAKAHRTGFVKFGRRNELAFGQRMEDDGHRSAVRAFFNTLAA
jgi:hypothetical protein